MVAVDNLALIVEVLSETTRNFEPGTKQRNYRNIPSLRQLLSIEREEMLVTSYNLSPGSTEWRLRDYADPDDELTILGQGSVKMSDLYKKVGSKSSELS